MLCLETMKRVFKEENDWYVPLCTSQRIQGDKRRKYFYFLCLQWYLTKNGSQLHLILYG